MARLCADGLAREREVSSEMSYIESNSRELRVKHLQKRPDTRYAGCPRERIGRHRNEIAIERCREI